MRCIYDYDVNKRGKKYCNTLEIIVYEKILICCLTLNSLKTILNLLVIIIFKRK